MTAVVELNDVYPVVRELIADGLGIEIEDIQPDSLFEDDLGGESIDYLDLQFQVEKRLGIKNSILGVIKYDAWECDADGRLTPSCLVRLQTQFSTLDWTPLTSQPGPQLPKQLMTVGNICKLIQRAAGQQ